MTKISFLFVFVFAFGLLNAGNTSVISEKALDITPTCTETHAVFVGEVYLHSYTEEVEGSDCGITVHWL